MKMPFRLGYIVGGLMLASGCGSVSAQTAQPPVVSAPVPPAPKGPMEPADVASSKKGADKQIQAGFQKKHEEFLARGKAGKIGVLFLGDSITAGWAGRGKTTWETNYTKYDPANFGIGGDRTQHILWRIENGELDGIAPKVVVLMIGTNNSGYAADQIIAGNQKIVGEIQRKLPNTKILLLGIFPRGEDPKDPKTAALRDKIKTVNAALAKWDDGKKVRFLDIGAAFLAPEGVLPKDVMPDALHPNAKGYEIWAKAMQPLLDEMMQ